MKIEIPDELIVEQLSDQIISIVVKEIDKRLSLITKTLELPPYATQNELMEVLGVGNKKLKYWIDCGLTYQDWARAGRELTQFRFERDKVQEFLRTLEVHS